MNYKHSFLLFLYSHHPSVGLYFTLTDNLPEEFKNSPYTIEGYQKMLNNESCYRDNLVIPSLELALEFFGPSNNQLFGVCLNKNLKLSKEELFENNLNFRLINEFKYDFSKEELSVWIGKLKALPFPEIYLILKYLYDEEKWSGLRIIDKIAEAYLMDFVIEVEKIREFNNQLSDKE